MAYGDVTLEEIRRRFGVNNRVIRLFEATATTAPSELLQQIFSITRGLPVRREKYKAEALVFPLLLDLYQRNDGYFTIYSGESLNVDDRLNGYCDFILAKDVGSFDLQCPILPIVQAEKNDLDLGVEPCAAQMIGVKFFHEKKNARLEKIYGCVTTGNYWLFMKLEGDLFIDERKYSMFELNELLSVFQSIIDYYKDVLK